MTSIVSIGMVTAVGLDAPSACASMRGAVDGFQETRYVAPNGEWLVGAPIPLLTDVVGQERLARFAAGAIVECLADPAAIIDGRNIPILLCLPEAQRVGRPIGSDARFIHRVSEIAELEHHPRSAVIAHGRPSGLVALAAADRLLASHAADHVIIAGVDSYLTAQTVDQHLRQERLLTRDNPRGFIPGEASASLLCSRSGSDVRLAGLGLAREAAFIYNPQDLPLRADGMTEAYTQALGAAGIDMARLGYRISDLIGEPFWFKQTALASIRLVRGRHEFQDLWSPAECLGNIGAAVVPAMIGIAWTAQRKGYAAGDPVLIEASNDDGACGAAIFSRKSV
ncbi:3-oxoacyl-ACP synthase [Mesorhizobium sp.]|uniref:3-oxoacyl-ACP synthase n=1 Tax=Mesorhizobium sp. TaxID=1871066 RepID=UPI000FEA8DE8|nr:3-oxoacyl-ACP synthase [Mesorhizobium sp.]RWP27332.1 MAG: 3-oxoacyl-ACP synthase [Mesorhizobium sp.]TIL68882.1 MAG: 3-oxoacyl-ACP synthase [Mesorhizobium sp.]